MRKNMIAIILAVIILVVAIGAGTYALTPKYKTIEMSGLTLEVPDTNTSVQNNSINYNTYDDRENNLTIKTWSNIDGNDINGSMQAGYDIGMQRGSNVGTNTTYDNVSVYNKSGTYTYYSENIEKQYMIVITGTDIEQVTHTAKSINDTILPQTNNTNITIQNLTEETNNTTIGTDDTSSNKKSQTTASKKKSSASSSSSVREEDKVTADGWDPKKHEVSREDMDNGYQKVHYDDGYFRVVNKKGDILSYGY